MELFSENQLEWEDEMLIRREISVNGKSRAFINDSPVNLALLRSLGAYLVDLHQQFDTLELGDNGFQREVLDALAGNAKALSDYRDIYFQYLKLGKVLDELKQQQQQANKELDYHQFLHNELQETGMQENELENLDAELKLLSNAEQVKQQLESLYSAMTDGEEPLVQQVKILANKLKSLQTYLPLTAGLQERMLSVYTELKDISGEIQHLEGTVQHDPGKMERTNERIAIGYKLLKKHSVQTTAELIAIQNELEQKLTSIFNINDEIEKKQREWDALLKHCESLGALVTAARKKIIKPFEEKVSKLLRQVGMPNARLMVELKEARWYDAGGETVHFLFNANLPEGAVLQNRMEPLNKVASGGELSRLMLCIKSLVAKSLQLPTLIFDEIDSGISGEAARQVGNIMKELSNNHQLISITHQPQIAAKADAHYYVHKAIREDKIITSVRMLTNDERIMAIAQMLSGEKPTAAALANAKEMISN